MKAISIRPDYEKASHYGQYWAKELFNKVVKEVEEYTLVDLYKNDAVRGKLPKDVSGAIVSGVCHGNKEVIVGQHNSVLFRKGDKFTEDYCKDKHFWTLSCLARLPGCCLGWLNKEPGQQWATKKPSSSGSPDPVIQTARPNLSLIPTSRGFSLW